MADPVKILSSEVSVNSTPTNVSLASLVRVLNTSNSANALITHRDASNTIIGTLTLTFTGGDECCVFLMKDPTDTIQSNSATVVGASVGFY